jgi:hypothetical protein
MLIFAAWKINGEMVFLGISSHRFHRSIQSIREVHEIQPSIQWFIIFALSYGNFWDILCVLRPIQTEGKKEERSPLSARSIFFFASAFFSSFS